jgi:DNA-binding response OmpR family regulator
MTAGYKSGMLCLMVDQSQPRLILVADDDSDALNLVTIGISALGYQYIQAHDGQEAVQQFKKSAPDLAILDLMMPGLSGREVCQQIKGSEAGQHVPVLILTSCDVMQERITSLESGADDYLTKPFHLPELQARVKALLRVRDLNLRLWEKNQQLQEAQAKLVQQERQLAVMQVAGTAAHQLGQPLSAIMLNCHLLEKLKPEDDHYKQALAAIKQDVRRMAELIEKLKTVDAAKKKNYYGKTEILDLKGS